MHKIQHSETIKKNNENKGNEKNENKLYKWSILKLYFVFSSSHILFRSPKRKLYQYYVSVSSTETLLFGGRINLTVNNKRFQFRDQNGNYQEHHVEQACPYVKIFFGVF